MEEIPEDRPVSRPVRDEDGNSPTAGLPSAPLCKEEQERCPEPYEMTSSRSRVRMFLPHEGLICISTAQSNLYLPRVIKMVICSLPRMIPGS